MFSVIIPAYNAEKFISISIKSVLSQTHTHFELIVVDDGSIDSTREFVLQFHDKRIRYVYQKNAGVAAARNRGIRESIGEFVCFLDADDEWKNNHLEILDSMIRKYRKCGLYVTGYDVRLNNGKIIHRSEQILKHICEEQILSDNGYAILNEYGYFLNTNTVCCPREVFDKVGLFEVGVKNGEDDDMWYRLFAYYPIVISKISTTIYNRLNCGATGQREQIFDTPFLKRVEDILNSVEVPQYRKDSLQIWIQRNRLSRARKCILIGKKRQAWEIIKNIDIKKVSRKKYFETLFCMLISTKLVRGYIDKRDLGYYR